MKKFRKIFLIASLIFLSVFVVANFSFAQDKTQDKALEIQYPEIQGERPATIKTGFAEYVRYIFSFAIRIAGFIAFAVLVYGGIQYLTSAGNPAKIDDSKDIILSAFLGMVVLFSSYLILDKINPELVSFPKKFAIEKKQIAKGGVTSGYGVYLFSKDFNPEGEKPCLITNKCIRTLFDQPSLGYSGFKSFFRPEDIQKVKISYRIKDDIIKDKYAAILHEKEKYEGQCRIFLEQGTYDIFKKDGIFQTTIEGVGKINWARSATVFNRSDKWSGNVELHREPDYKDSKPHIIAGAELNPVELDPGLAENIQSIRINGNYIVVLFENGPPDFKQCAVFRNSYPDLKNSPIGRCGTHACAFGHCVGEFKCCAKYIAVYPTK